MNFSDEGWAVQITRPTVVAAMCGMRESTAIIIVSIGPECVPTTRIGATLGLMRQWSEETLPEITEPARKYLLLNFSH